MPETLPTFQFVADRGDAKLRLDQMLVRRVTDVSRLSRTRARLWIESGAVAVNGRTVRRPSVRILEGASVRVALPSSTVFKARPEPEESALDVLYEDDSLVIVNKPAGIVVHPSYKQLSGTLLNAVLWRVRGRTGLQPGIVTRLDKETSGLVLVALTPDVHARIQRAAAAGQVRKSYLACVRGWPRPRTGVLRLPLARDPNDRRRVIVTPEGAPSETRYAVVSTHGTGSRREAMVGCELVTGRTHQIRVHLASAGWPIVGDRIYGTSDPRIERQALHAHRLSFAHPVTGQALDVQAPLPSDMQRLLLPLPHP